MKTRKRILSFLLAVCLTLTAAIPAVFALEGEGGVLTYTFGINEDLKSGDVKGKNANTYNAYVEGSEGTPLINNDGFVLNTSSSRGYKCGTDFIQSRYNTSEGIGHWFAIRINDVKKDTYNMKFYYDETTNGGKYEIYIVSGAQYDSAVGSENFNTVCAGTSLSATANQLIYESITDVAVNANKVGKIDAYASETTGSVEYDMGNVSFPYNGTEVEDYVLIFWCVGATSTTNCLLALKSLTMTPVAEEAKNVAQVGNVKFDDLASAITAASNGETKEVDLLASCTATDITITDGVTLDLKGNNLTANTVTILNGGSVIDTGATAGVLTAELSASGSGDNGGYLPISTATNTYKFYKVTVTATNVDTGVENTMKLKFQVKFDNTAAYDALAAGTSGATIGGIFTWAGNENREHDITYEDGTSLAQKWGQEVVAHSYNKNGSIVLSFSGTDAFEGLTVVPYIQCAGATIKAA